MMTRHPARALLLGVPFLVIGVIYWLATGYLGGSADAAGAAMLIALGIAMSTMAFVLVVGSPSGDENAQDAGSH
jgi:hypothetical protein